LSGNSSTEFVTGGIFVTYPAQHLTVVGVIIDQIIATGVLMFGILSITDEKWN